MSLPRAVVPGRCYMITRRCSELRFFLRRTRRPTARSCTAWLWLRGRWEATWASKRGLRELPHAEFAQRLQERITAVEREAAAERARTGRRIVGPRGALDQHWGDSPRSRESRRQLPPRVACQNLWRRIETLGRNKAWIEACREARAAFLAGAKACFPAGTFWLKRHASVACEPFPSD